MLIHLIAAARPNFMKVAPLYHALQKEPWARSVIVHTGQHYDANMSDAFFQDLGLPEPGFHLGVGSGSHAEQTGKVLMAYEKVLEAKRPDLVVVVGDVNSTMAATLAAVKLEVKVAHLEAGLRSFDRTMPEEINRLVTDALADILWTPSPDADGNLIREGVSPNKIVRVGNIMIDSLEMLRERIESQAVHERLCLDQGRYGVVTLHRPSNVDEPGSLKALAATLARIARKSPLVFPVHPRTRKNLLTHGLMEVLQRAHELVLTEPLPYIEFMSLVFNCRFIITDSGGIQEESTYLGIPCLTLRSNTERPITISQGTNKLCTVDRLETEVDRVLSCEKGKGAVPEYWDGHTSQRIVEYLKTVWTKRVGKPFQAAF